MDIKRHGMKLGWLLLALFATALGAAQELRDGTRLLLTDIDSKSIVGYGEVSRRELELSLGRGSGSFLLVLVQPDGTVETFRGEVTVDGFDLITSPGRRISLDALLRRAQVDLTLHRLDADTYRATPRADGSAEDDGRRGEVRLPGTADGPGQPAGSPSQDLSDDGSGDPYGDDSNSDADHGESDNEDVDKEDDGDSGSGGVDDNEDDDDDSGPGTDDDDSDDGSGEDDDRDEEPDGDDD